MRITGGSRPGSTNRATRSRKPRSGSGGSGKFSAVASADSSSEADQLHRASLPLADLTELIGLQEVLDQPANIPTRLRNGTRALRWGQSVISQMDSLHQCLLRGAEPTHTVEKLSRLLDRERMPSGNAGLDDVVSAIATRAAVEIEKHRFVDPHSDGGVGSAESSLNIVTK